jgi:hypothetical protein
MTRQLTGWLFTLIWSVTGLLQVAAPPCLHHGASAAAVGLSADPHAAHHTIDAAAGVQAEHGSSATVSHAHAGHSMPAPHADAPSAPTGHSGHEAPCDCLTACCITAPASLARSAVAPVATVAAVHAHPSDTARDAVVVPSADHRQPPATAPPGSRDC